MDTTKFDGIIEATGAGAFGVLEYEGDRVIMRTEGMKTTEVSGAVRVYFDGKRNQLMTGRRFEPMGLWFLRAGSVYKVITNIRVVDIPKGVTMKVILNDDARDVMMLTGDEVRVDEKGKLSFMILPFRRIEMEKLTSIAFLEISGVPVKKAPAKKTPVKKKAAKDESDVPVEHPDTLAS